METKKIKIIVLMLIFSILMINVNAQEQKDYYDSGELKSVGSFTNEKQTGEWKFYYKSGSLQTIVNYNSNGVQIGIKDYHENGNLIKEGHYDSDGKGKGQWKTYHENGTLKSIGNYSAGRLTGEKKTYYENGTLESIGNFSEGNPIGEFKFYNKLGWLADIHNYENGEKISLSKGCYSGNCENGYGKKFLGWGKRQEGNFTNGLLNGKGIEISTMSGVLHYEGEFLNGKRNGEGTELNTEITRKYVGHWKDGERNGEGTLTKYNFLLGGTLMEKYIGNWENGNKAGQATIIEYDHLGKKEERKLVGIWTWDDNDKPTGTGKEYINGELVYEGTFKNGKPFKTEGCVAGDCENGQGVFVTAKHVKYIGGFKNGMKNGFGFELDPKQGMYILVNWKDGKEHGYAKIFNVNNELVYAAEMKDGNAVTKFADNGVDVGCVKGDCENGFGNFVWDDGIKYIGEFKNGIINGLGTLTWPEGKYIGSFKNAKRNGYGRQYDKNNTLQYDGEWGDDTFYTDTKIEKKYSKDEKCTVGNCIDGFGIFIETFEPGWNDAYREYVNTYEIKYEGFWKEGKFHGLGFTDDRMAKTFVGLFENGQAVK